MPYNLFGVLEVLRPLIEAAARERRKIAVEKGRRAYFDTEKMPPLERDLQGILAEVHYIHYYPFVKLGGPFVSREDDHYADFVYTRSAEDFGALAGDVHIDVKCGMTGVSAPWLLLNVDEYKKKAQFFDVFYFFRITKPAGSATTILDMGWIPSEEMPEYDRQSFVEEGGECFKIPKKKGRPPWKLGPDFNWPSTLKIPSRELIEALRL